MKTRVSLLALATLTLGGSTIVAAFAGGIEKQVIGPKKYQFRIEAASNLSKLDCANAYEALESYTSRGCFNKPDAAGCGSALSWLKLATVTNSDPYAEDGRFKTELMIQDEYEVPLASYSVENRFDREYATLISLVSAGGGLEIETNNGVDLDTLIKRLDAPAFAELNQGARGQISLTLRNKLVACELVKGNVKFRTTGSIKLGTENAFVENRYRVLEQVLQAVEKLKKSSADDLEKYFRLGLAVGEAMSLTHLSKRPIDERITGALSLEKMIMRHDLKKFMTTYRDVTDAMNALDRNHYEVSNAAIELSI